jgi:hypothetical protein
MSHPIEGLWRVEIELDGQRTHVTHAYHADGLMQLHAGEHGASFVWQAMDERRFRFRGTRPIEPQAFEFHGWQHAAGEGEVSADGATFQGRETTDGPHDGRRVVRKARLHGTRVDVDSPLSQPERSTEVR